MTKKKFIFIKAKYKYNEKTGQGECSAKRFGLRPKYNGDKGGKGRRFDFVYVKALIR